jgi:endoglucanase
VAREAEARGWSCAYWQYDSDFILYNISAGKWSEPLRDALIPRTGR